MVEMNGFCGNLSQHNLNFAMLIYLLFKVKLLIATINDVQCH